MSVHRRELLTLSALATVPFAGPALAASPMAPAPAMGGGAIDASHLGLNPGAPDDQTRALQAAIDRTAAARLPLFLPPGHYRAGDLVLPSGAQLFGVRGATRLVLAGSLTAARGDAVTLANLVVDGAGRPLPERRGLVHLFGARAARIADCDIVGAGGTALMLEACDGTVSGCTITGARDAAIFALDSKGLAITGNTLRGVGDNGILVWRSQAGDDGTLVTGNRIEEIAARSGGSGQYGNGINVFRAGNVIVSGNRVRGCAFSAVRGNAASNLDVTGNTCSALGEVAMYAEFGFEGAVISGNTVDGAAIGVSITNFNEGGRLAVCQGNIVRNLVGKRPPGTDPGDLAGIGISVEADTAVTGNVVEGAPTAGIWLGWGRYLRDVTVTGNVVRGSDIGIAVQVAQGAGAAVIADNLVSGSRRAAIAAMEWTRLSADLTREAMPSAPRYAQLSVTGNRVR